MRRVVLESPYRGATPAETTRNVLYAERALVDCLKRNEAPIASHLLFTRPGVLDDADDAQRRLGMQAGHAWIKAAHAVVCYLDYGESRGMTQGKLIAARAHIPIEARFIGRNPGDE